MMVVVVYSRLVCSLVHVFVWMYIHTWLKCTYNGPLTGKNFLAAYPHSTVSCQYHCHLMLPLFVCVMTCMFTFCWCPKPCYCISTGLCTLQPLLISGCTPSLPRCLLSWCQCSLLLVTSLHWCCTLVGCFSPTWDMEVSLCVPVAVCMALLTCKRITLFQWLFVHTIMCRFSWT